MVHPPACLHTLWMGTVAASSSEVRDRSPRSPSRPGLSRFVSDDPASEVTGPQQGKKARELGLRGDYVFSPHPFLDRSPLKWTD